MKATIPQSYYDSVASELARNPPITGLWAKAYAEAEGEIGKARALYLQLRAQQLLDDASRREQQILDDAVRQERQLAQKALDESRPARIKILEQGAAWAQLVGLVYVAILVFAGKHVAPAVTAWVDEHFSGVSTYTRLLIFAGIYLPVPAIAWGVWLWAQKALARIRKIEG